MSLDGPGRVDAVRRAADAHRRRISIARCCATRGICSRTKPSRPRCSPTSRKAAWSRACSIWCRCATPTGANTVDWPRSTGTLKVAGLATGERGPAATRGRTRHGRVRARQHAAAARRRRARRSRRHLGAHRLAAQRARRACTPRCRAICPRRCCAARCRRRGSNSSQARWSLDADARGEKRTAPTRSVARDARSVSDASIPLGGRSAARRKTRRHRALSAAASLRGLALEGNWLGGPVDHRIASRGGARRPQLRHAVASPMPRRCCDLLGHDEAASRVSGQLAWTGSAQGADDELADLARQQSGRRREPSARAFRQDPRAHASRERAAARRCRWHS